MKYRLQYLSDAGTVRYEDVTLSTARMAFALGLANEGERETLTCLTEVDSGRVVWVTGQGGADL